MQHNFYIKQNLCQLFMRGKALKNRENPQRAILVRTDLAQKFYDCTKLVRLHIVVRN